MIWARPLQRLLAAGRPTAQTIRCRLVVATAPSVPMLITNALADAARSRAGLIAKNALLRHQLSIVRRQVKRPVLAAKSICLSWLV